MIHVVGGVYLETAPRRRYEAVFGSGGRGAAVLSSLGNEVTLHTAGTAVSLDAASDLAFSYEFELESTTVGAAYRFEYPHLAADPYLTPSRPESKAEMPELDARHAVVYGMLEADARVRADRLVFDPQSPGRADFHDPNRLQADQVAYVLNSGEARRITGAATTHEAGARLLEHSGALVCVIKDGAAGGLVFVRDREPMRFSAFETASVWPIGSGDVFTAAFAHAWFSGGEPLECATLASKATAFHSQNRAFPTREQLAEAEFKPASAPSEGELIYLAAPFFASGELRFVDELRSALLKGGAKVFSPYHDVGLGSSAAVVGQDLSGLERATAVLAVIDGGDIGTVFEVGYARAKGIPVVALAERVPNEDLMMLEGSGCEIVADTATALYRSIWLSRS